MNTYRGLKRLTDFFFSIVLLVPAIPICLISALFIILETNGNPLYIQERVGLNGNKFKIYKLRSMYNDAEKDGHKWEFLKEMPDFNDRLAVKPGITGWAQVNGGYELSPKEKLQYDQYYIAHEGLKLDTLILFKTIKVVFTGEGSR